MKLRYMTPLPVALAGLTFSQTSIAADEWKYEFTPYLFAAGMKGNIGVGGLPPFSIDASFSDIADKLEMGFMGMFTAQNGPWVLGFDGAYMKLEAGGLGPFGGTTLTNKMLIVQGSVGYRVFEGDGSRLDLIGGVRYTKLEAGLAGVINASGSESWADAVVGFRAILPMSENTDAVVYADVGGGGSDLTYQFMLGVNWEFREGYTAKFGYRYLDVDYNKGGVLFDVAASGPYLGIGIAF